MANQRPSIETIAKELNTTIERLSKCSTKDIDTLVEHYKAYKKAQREYETDRILYFLDRDRPTTNN